MPEKNGAPKWDTTAEEFMRSIGHDTAPELLRDYNEEIRVLTCQDGNGNPSLASVDGDGAIENPSLSTSFNPNHN